jgi:sodium/potassium-transporting ATPase subunit alpha
VFSGTLCTQGTGIGIVFKTGENTVIGRIINLLPTTNVQKPTVNKEVDYFIVRIFKVAVATGVLYFILGCILQFRMVTNIIYAIGIIIA